jgi:hypothetical protein
MAVMCPREIWAPDLKSPGERKVFEALRDGLSDEWQVYHAVGWVVRDPAEGALDGEIDFVLCHPARGVLCLEVKGGSVECHYGAWHRHGDDGRVRMDDPFLQALDHRYALARFLKARGLADAKGWLIAHAVAFPDITVHELALPPNAPPEIVIDRAGLREPEASVDRVMAFHRGARDKRHLPGDAGAAALRDLLGPPRLPVPLARKALDDEVELIQLTDEQSRLLTCMAMNKRVAVIGCAGSGKTVLAVEHAKRIAEGGARVLFVCFNRGLANHLRARERDSGVEFRTFHALCKEQAERAGIEIYDWGDEDPPQSYWDVDLPEALLEAIERLGPQYDALFVDEAQDLDPDWYVSLQCLLRDEHKADIWMFYDANQRIFGKGMSPPEDFAKYPLAVNCRNTQEIHREALAYYKGAVKPEVQGPRGRPVERVSCDAQPAAVATLVKRLCDEDDFPPQDIVVLSGHGVAHSRVFNEWDGSYALTRERGELGRNVFFSSIRGFKGLESPVVILCELEDLDEDTREQQLYVGISRAQTHCIVVEQPSTDDEER